MTRFSAFLDACALVPIAQADTLLRLAQVGIYRPLWSEKVLQETVKAIEIIHPGYSAFRGSGEASEPDERLLP